MLKKLKNMFKRNKKPARKKKPVDDVYPFKQTVRKYQPRKIDQQYFTLVNFAAHPSLQKLAARCVGPQWLPESIATADDSAKKDYSKAKVIIKKAVTKKLIQFDHGDLRLGSLGKRARPFLSAMDEMIGSKLKPMVTMFLLSAVAFIFSIVAGHADPANIAGIISEVCGDVFIVAFYILYRRNRMAKKARYSLLRVMSTMKPVKSGKSASSRKAPHTEATWEVWKQATPHK